MDRTKGKSGKSDKPKSKPLLPKKEKQLLQALTLFSLSVFLLGSMIPVSEERFPSGNLMGELGLQTASFLISVFGASAIFLSPLLLTLALYVKGWVPNNFKKQVPNSLRKKKWIRLWIGLLIFGPILLRTLPQTRGIAADWGHWGELVGSVLERYLGIFDAVFMILLMVAFFIYTIGWNPIQDVVRVFELIFRIIRQLVSLLASNSLLKKKKSAGELEDTIPLEILDGHTHDDDWIEDAVETSEDENEQGVGVEKYEATLSEEVELPDDEDDQTVMDLGEGSFEDLMQSFEVSDREDREALEATMDKLGHKLIATLASFDIKATYDAKTVGPSVTQFEVIPHEGVKVSKIQNLDADLALAMKAESIRIIAPIPGKGAVGVEIPNPKPEFVMLGDILQSPEYRDRSKTTLPMALGNDLEGEPYIADLAKMPHILIAGATGTGKSVCLNAIITSLICRHGQDKLDLLMVDPKMVELSAYKQLPHLRKSVVTDPTKAARTLKWAVIEMERRYKLLSLNGVRSIGEFNNRLEEDRTELQGYDSEGEIVPYSLSKDEGRTLRYVVVVIDELADLMMTVKADIEKPLITLAQKARAIGIHLIVATQRPSVNVITGLIKANFPSRIAFRVASKVDSRTILDQNGAETLLGNGDMLFLPPGANESIRIQGAYVSTEETDKMMKWYVKQRDQGNPLMVRPEGEEDIFDEQHRYEVEEAVGANNLPSEDSDCDEFFRAAAEVCIQQDQGSTSLLQRRLKIGYGRAARIVDQLYDNGILGPPEGSKGREVLVGIDQLDLICDELGIQ